MLVVRVLGAVAAGYVIAAIFAGRLGDRFGLARVIFFASFIYGGGFLAAGFAQEWHDWYFGFITAVSIAGGIVMTLAWGLLYKIVPVEHRGADLRARDDDEGDRAAGRRAAGRPCDRPVAAVLPQDRRLPGALADLRGADPLCDPAAGAVDANRAENEREVPLL